MGELVGVRRGTERADDVHPPEWWLLSQSARRDAAAAWKVKHGEILRAQNRRSITREPLATMPPSTAARAVSPVLAAPAMVLPSTIDKVAQHKSTTNTRGNSEGADALWLKPAMACNNNGVDDDPFSTVGWRVER